MSLHPKRAPWLIAGILISYVTLATWYSLTIPLGEAPDEVPHFTYVRYLVRHHRLPTTTDEHEAFQPPLYYALGAGLTFWIEDEGDAPFTVRANAYYDPDNPDAPKNLLLHTAYEAFPYRGWVLAWHLLRLLSIILGGVTVWAVYQMGRTVFPTEPAIPLTMAALTAFTPQFLFLSAVVNNDNAATAFSALTLWQVAALLRERSQSQLWRRSAILGVLLGLGLLSKSSLMALVPVAGLGIVISTLRVQSSDVKAKLWHSTLRLLLMTSMASLIYGWYPVRNWRLYGDMLGWAFTLQTNAQREGPLTTAVMAWLVRGVYRSFWLGWIGIEFDEFIYWLLGLVCLAGSAGFLLWLIRRWRTLDGGTKWSLGLLGLHAAITLASLIQWTATVLGTDQGRLVYPMLPTVMLVLAAGWAWWARGQARAWLLGALVAGMMILAVLTPILYIAPVHAPAPEAIPTELAAATPLNVDWDGVRLLGYRLESSQVQPGGTLILHLYWEGLRPVERTLYPAQDLMALIQLVDKDGEFLMYADGSPTAGRDTTDRWTPGVPLASRHLLPVPDYGEPGNYRLTITLHPFGEQNWLTATGPDGMVVGDQLVLPQSIQLVAP